MSVGAATFDAGFVTAMFAAVRSMTTLSRSTTPTNGRPCRSNVPSLNGVGAGCATAAVATTRAARSPPASASFMTIPPRMRPWHAPRVGVIVTCAALAPPTGRALTLDLAPDVDGERLDRRGVELVDPRGATAHAAGRDRGGDRAAVFAVDPYVVGQVGPAIRLVAHAFGAVALDALAEFHLAARRGRRVGLLVRQRQHVLGHVAYLLARQRAERREGRHLGVARIGAVAVERLVVDGRAVLIAHAVADRLLELGNRADVARLLARDTPDELEVGQVRYAGLAVHVGAVAAGAVRRVGFLGRRGDECVGFRVGLDRVRRCGGDALGDGQRAHGLRARDGEREDSGCK